MSGSAREGAAEGEPPCGWLRVDGRDLACAAVGAAVGAVAGLLLMRRWRRARRSPGAPAPHLLDTPPRYAQDTVRIDGEAAIHPPPGSELIQRSRVQG